MAKGIALQLGAELNDEEADIFADGYNAALQSFGNPEQLEPVSNRDELPYDPQIAEYEKIMQQAIPDGYVLVPVEPTPKMKRAALFKNTNDAVWKAMLTAAPKV